MIPLNNCDCEKCATDRMLKEVILPIPCMFPSPALFELVSAFENSYRALYGSTFKRRWWQDDQLFEELIPAEKIFIGVDVAKPLSEYTHESASVPFMIDPAVVDEDVGPEYEAWDELSALVANQLPALGAAYGAVPQKFFERFNDIHKELWEKAVNVNEMSMNATLQDGIVSPNPKAPFVKSEAIPDWAALYDPAPGPQPVCINGEVDEEIPPSADASPDHESENPTSGPDGDLEDALHQLRSLNAEAILAGQFTAEIKDGVIEIRTYERSHALDVLEAAAKAKPEDYRRAHNPATCPECQDDLIQGTLADQIAYYREVTRLRTEGVYRLIYSAKPYGQALFQTYLDAAGDIALLLALLERR